MKIFRFFASMTVSLLLLTAVPCLAGGGHGTPFFLLSDASYGSKDMAMVRLETLDIRPVADYGGVDVYVYQIKHPLAFLQAQKNLHRIDTKGNYEGEGLSNVLSRAWDKWWVESRKAWRKLFSLDARKAVAAEAPGVRTHPLANTDTPRILNPQYQPMKGYQLVESFRYPVHIAKPIQPPKGVALAGSSSNFFAAPNGNVMIPLGKREPGLYLVEAMVGDHRASTLVFVSDSIAVTKVSGNQMLVWVADRRNGKPVPSAGIMWSDGVGVLAHGKTGRQGIVIFHRKSPEKTYVYGEDLSGGVFISEEYYFDSEIYNTKLYAVTDRPLYRSGDTVFVKFLGRTFLSSRKSVPIAAGDIRLQVFDSTGFPLASQTLHVTPDSGGNTSFQLPDNALAGGYELRFEYMGNTYGAAFRVAQYQKPHFAIHIIPGKRNYKTNEVVKGNLQLVYPDGRPVANAHASLTLRAQRMTMIEGDLGYAGQFPVQLDTAELTTDARGMASFVLPAAADPSRYVISVLATDGAAYRVRATSEILVERSAGTYALKAASAFSAPGESVAFSYRELPNSGIDSTQSPPASWDWIRLEDRNTDHGVLADKGKFALTFSGPGTYTVSLRDASGNIIGATSHYVSGGSIGAPQGSIEMVFGKSDYKPGDTASALITFPKKVDQALFTLEGDRVEKTALMASASGWVHAERLSSRQWKVEIPVKSDYGPNITFSVAYVKDGDYVFQNLGLKVKQPRIEVSVHADKAVYAPGDRVTLDLTALQGGKATAGTHLTVSVVDEMIYVLQPEIAPNISDFFYHPRRNNVRTSASLNFIGYDLAHPPSSMALPTRGQTHERAIKLLERPRREDKDTAFWQPDVTVDRNGHARISFIMPDSITRWRITVRAMSSSGTVGQNISHVRSDKAFYVKWTAPNWMRAQDEPKASVAIFNQGNRAATVELVANSTGLRLRKTVKVSPGANFVSLPLRAAATERQIDLALSVDGKSVDALSVPLEIVPTNWLNQRSMNIPIAGKKTAIRLPVDAGNIRLQFTDGVNTQFRRIMDDLIDYPYGCVEQTASRLIPYSMALQSVLPGNERLASKLRQRLNSYRFRLAQMAGPQATFGWWSSPEQDGDAFLTTYAYYADWHASRALGITLPDGNFDRLLDVYRNHGVQRSPWLRSLMLYWMQEMGLPVRSLAQALTEEQSRAAGNATKKASPMSSMVFARDEDDLQNALGTLLAAYVVRETHGTLAPNIGAILDRDAKLARQSGLPLAQALLIMTGRRPAADASGVLEQVRAEMPTIDRTLTLLWIHRALSDASTPALRSSAIALDAPWQGTETVTGQKIFRWPSAKTVPTSIDLESPPSKGMTAVAQFESLENATTHLPVHVERRLYRLVKAAGAKANDAGNNNAQAAVANISTYRLELLSPNAVLGTDEVYLDEIVLTLLTKGAPLHYGIVEVPLPPGATPDRTTWGFNLLIPGSSNAEPLERARFEETPRGYSVPIETLDGTMVIRHLIRAAEKGRFMLPPVRYYRMYQPEQKAYEDKTRAYLEIR